MSNLILLKSFLPITIDWGIISTFFFGIFFGMCFAVLIYIYVVVKYLGKNAYIKKVKAENIEEEEILRFIKEAQEKFKDKNLLENNNQFNHMYNVICDLSLKIARRFYPNSKYPLLELSIDESLLLFVYISQRIDSILDKRGLRMFRRVTISQIIKLTNTKKAIDESTLMKLHEKLNVKDVSKVTFSVLNIFNPFYWAKKLIINKSFEIITRKICLIVVGIVGEEFYTVYSKNVFKVEQKIDSDIDSIVKELKDELILEEEQNEPAVKEKKNKKNVQSKEENINVFELAKRDTKKNKKRVFSDGLFDRLLNKKIKK